MAIKKITRNPRGRGNVLRSDQIGPASDKELQELAEIIKAYIIETAERGGRHKFRKDKSGFVAETKVFFDTDGIVIRLPDYAQNIDKGRRPGAKGVPILELVKWIKRYRVGGRANPGGRFKKVKAGDVNSIAYAMQKAIIKNGIKARPFIQQSLQFAEELLAEAIDTIIIPEIITKLEFIFK